jgi:L-lactate dehydrogenase complex protein LldG
MPTRAEFLARLRAQTSRAPARFAASTATRPARPRERLEILKRELAERWYQNLDRFTREFERVAGVLHRVGEAREVPEVLARIASERQARSLVAWNAEVLGLDVAAPLAARGLTVSAAPDAEVAADERQRRRGLAAVADLGVTGVDLAIAETGTMVLVSGAGRPRSASLLPPCHVAVFDRGVLVTTLLQAGLVLEAWHDGVAPAERGASINFITGPSRTADIELTLTRGVHGPKEVHAIFVEQGLPAERRV